MQIWARIRGKCGPVKSDLSFKMSMKICLVTQSPFWLCCLVPRASIFGEPRRFQAWLTSQTFLDILFLCRNIIIKFAICEHWGLRTSCLPTDLLYPFTNCFVKLIFLPLPTSPYKSICISFFFFFFFFNFVM